MLTMVKKGTNGHPSFGGKQGTRQGPVLVNLIRGPELTVRVVYLRGRRPLNNPYRLENSQKARLAVVCTFPLRTITLTSRTC